MRVAVGADHRGYETKTKIVSLLERLEHVVVDVGTRSTESVDYPDIAESVGRKVATGEVDRGVSKNCDPPSRWHVRRRAARPEAY